MADYSMIGAFGSDASKSLSGDIIEKLKAADEKAQIEPIDKDLKTWDTELEKVNEIKASFSDLMSASNTFDLYSPSTNVFDQVSASVGGSGAAQFDAADITQLPEGTTTVHVDQLAQKDVFQTDTFSDPTADIDGGQDDGDKITIAIDLNGDGDTDDDNETVDFSTEGKSYEDLVKDINANENFTASIEKVGDNDYRIIIKSANTGEANSLTITQTGVDLNVVGETSNAIDSDNGVGDDGTLTIDGTDVDFTKGDTADDIKKKIDDAGIDGINVVVNDNKLRIYKDDGTTLSLSNSGFDLGLNYDSHVLTAQNFKATIDGVDYDVSSDNIQLDSGLTITANKVDADGENSTLSIKKDTSGVIPAIDSIVEKYNSIIDLIDTELYDPETSLKDTNTFRTIESDLKNMFFGQYGDDDLSVFNYGFSFDKEGHLSYDSDILGKAITDHPDDIKTLFTGVAEDEGIGTRMKRYFVDLDLSDGLMSQYTDAMDTRKTKLETEKEKAQKTIDDRYDALAQQFVAYGAVISNMEQSFAGLKMIIDNPPKD